MTLQKLCVFPNDALLSYYKKGEIKEGYFNPKNFFNEVHIISLFDEEINEDIVKPLAGQGKLFIHNLGKANLSNFKSFEERVTFLIKWINPGLIRSFNPRVQGWLAAKAALKLHIPLIISLHTNYDQQRNLTKNFKQFVKLHYAKKLEKFALQNADAVICVYNFIVPYAKKMGANNIQLIYNKVDLNKFTTKPIEHSKPLILSIGQLIDQKPHRHLVQAMTDIDAKLIIIGDGPNLESLTKLIETFNLKNKVEIIKSVSNNNLPFYYNRSDVYVQPMNNLGGIPIPVLEAMACGLPVIMSEHSDKYSEIIDDAVIFTKNNPYYFLLAIRRIWFNDELKKQLIQKSLNLIDKISGDKMEEKELLLYKKVMNQRLGSEIIR